MTEDIRTATGKVPVDKRPDQSWLDYLCVLLHIGAEIEHALMVEYLYAGYSLGGSRVPAEHRKSVLRWRDTILMTAREEMGHLLCVQNLLCLLGAPINFGRSDFPFDSPYYPFPFSLERLSMHSLSRYVYAEKPEPMSDDSAQIEREIAAQATRHVESEVVHPHPVGEIYERIIELLADETRIPDSAFRFETYGCQASWDEWGKGYRPGPGEDNAVLADERRTGSEQDALPRGARSACVLVERMGTRTEAVAALRRIAEQGEAPHLIGPKGALKDADEPSHFERFVFVYDEFSKVHESWEPTDPYIPINPTALDPAVFPRSESLTGGVGATFIESGQSRTWANLFDLRYRMLLTYLTHMFRIARETSVAGCGLRGPTLHRIFGEMYNIKTLSCMLLRMPLTDDPADPRRAGPPFSLPYTLALPTSEADCWRLHLDLLGSAQSIARSLLTKATGADQRYLGALLDLDRQSADWIRQVLIGLPRGRMRVGT